MNNYRKTARNTNREQDSLRMGYKMSQIQQRFADATVLLATEPPSLPLVSLWKLELWAGFGPLTLLEFLALI